MGHSFDVGTLQFAAHVLAAGSGMEIQEAVLQNTFALFETMSETLLRIRDWPFCLNAMKGFKAWKKTSLLVRLTQGETNTSGISDKLFEFVNAVDVKASEEIEVTGVEVGLLVWGVWEKSWC